MDKRDKEGKCDWCDRWGRIYNDKGEKLCKLCISELYGMTDEEYVDICEREERQ